MPGHFERYGRCRRPLNNARAVLLVINIPASCLGVLSGCFYLLMLLNAGGRADVHNGGVLKFRIHAGVSFISQPERMGPGGPGKRDLKGACYVTWRDVYRTIEFPYWQVAANEHLPCRHLTSGNFPTERHPSASGVLSRLCTERK
uniref:Uncharacterized protein n=1 Tax=Anopheles culicifacies TaxID=139723 RepID=A0A182MBJ1_9DIPT